MQFLFQRLKTNPLLRISIHPVDLHHAAIWRQIEQLIARALEDRVALTYHAWLAAQRVIDSQACSPLPLKADLHLHSRHSDRAPEWLFRRVGASRQLFRPGRTLRRLAPGGGWISSRSPITTA
jgi:hypothetical protein